MDYSIKKRDGFVGEKIIIVPIETFKNFISNEMVRRLYLTDIGYFPNAKNHYRCRVDGVEEYIIIFCVAGKGYIELKGRIITLQENTAFCIPANTGHIYYSDKDTPWSILWVHFKGDDVKQYPLDKLELINTFSENSTNRMIYLFELLFKVLEDNYTLGNFIYISNCLQVILTETYYRQNFSSMETQNKQATVLIRYMYKNLNKNLTLEDLSLEFKLSKSYINLVFKESTGYSPIEFFNDLKMKRACRLLRTTDKYIYEIAFEMGYKDQYYFSRIFTKTIGVSPKTYRKSNVVVPL